MNMKKRLIQYIGMLVACLLVPATLYAWEGKVVDVPEGDVLVVLNSGKQETVRLANADCPEIGQPWSEAAKKFTHSMVFGKTVKIWPAGIGTDEAPMVFVFYKDKNLNRELLAAGLAWYAKTRGRDPGFVALEAKARAGNLGLWQDRNPVPPWEYRRGR